MENSLCGLIHSPPGDGFGKPAGSDQDFHDTVGTLPSISIMDIPSPFALTIPPSKLWYANPVNIAAPYR
jgi:hypothetical protein